MEIKKKFESEELEQKIGEWAKEDIDKGRVSGSQSDHSSGKGFIQIGQG